MHIIVAERAADFPHNSRKHRLSAPLTDGEGEHLGNPGTVSDLPVYRPLKKAMGERSATFGHFLSAFRVTSLKRRVFRISINSCYYRNK
jgi:hypothetical protein